jgi:purine-binding chemotaxis protein CheW
MHTKDRKLKNKYKKISAAYFLPKDAISQQILLERAHLLAKEKVNKDEQESLIKYIRFRLGQNESYGIPYEKTNEIIENTLLTRVPHVPFFIAGVINRRGTLIAVIDLKKLFRSPATEEIGNNYIIIVHTQNNMVIGILVDYIDESDVYNPSLLDPAISSQGVASQYILGIHEGRTAIINIETMLSDPSLHLTKS